jgi:hypothetical protein
MNRLGNNAKWVVDGVQHVLYAIMMELLLHTICS